MTTSEKPVKLSFEFGRSLSGELYIRGEYDEATDKAKQTQRNVTLQIVDRQNLIPDGIKLTGVVVEDSFYVNQVMEVHAGKLCPTTQATTSDLVKALGFDFREGFE